MQFLFKPMDEPSAQAIAKWHYEGIYAFYDMDQDREDLEELLAPDNWPDKYYAVVNEGGELVGFFSFEPEDEALVIGLGLKPDCTGKGLGHAFVKAGLAYARQKFNPAAFRLDVAAFNRRAISVYEKLGFKSEGVFMRETNGGQVAFLRMVRKA